MFRAVAETDRVVAESWRSCQRAVGPEGSKNSGRAGLLYHHLFLLQLRGAKKIIIGDILSSSEDSVADFFETILGKENHHSGELRFELAR